MFCGIFLVKKNCNNLQLNIKKIVNYTVLFFKNMFYNTYKVTILY